MVQRHQKLDGDGSEGAGRPSNGSGRLQTCSHQWPEGVRDLTTTIVDFVKDEPVQLIRHECKQGKGREGKGKKRQGRKGKGVGKNSC